MIVVFGSINVDLVAHAAALPRAGITQFADRFVMGPGGKGANQALAARHAGAKVALHGCVGNDAFAPMAVATLRDAGVDVSGVVECDAPTGVALIHVNDAGENTITVAPGANARALCAQLSDEALSPQTTLLLQLEVPQREIELLVARARQRGARVVLNAAPARPLAPAMLAALDALIVNEHEAATLAQSLGLPSEPEKFASALAANGPAVVVTLGARGAIACARGETMRLAPPRVSVVDTVGAGDAFVGAFAAALDAGSPLAHALRLGVAAGSLACTQQGAQASLPKASAITALAATIAVAPG